MWVTWGLVLVLPSIGIWSMHLVNQENDTIDMIVRDNAGNTNQQVDHSDDKVWLFAVSGNRKPYAFVDSTGRLAGFNIDLISKVCEIANKKCKPVIVEYTECSMTERNRNYAGRGLMAGWFDACPGYVTSVDRKASFDFTKPFLSTYSTFTVAPGNPSGFDPDHHDFSQFTFTHLDGAVTNAECLTRLGKQFGKIIVAANLPEAKNLILNRTADVLFSPRAYIPDLQTFSQKYQCDDGGVAVMLKKGSPMACWWDPAFAQLVNDGTYASLCASSQVTYNATIKCLTNQVQVPPVVKPPSKVWLFGISGRRKPFAYLDDNGRVTGFNVDFVHAVCAEAGQKCEFVLTPFTECSFTSRETNYAGRGLMDGWFDACPGYADSVDRANAVDFTDAFLVSEAYFAVKPGNPRHFDPHSSDFSKFTITHLTGAYTNAACLTRLNKTFGNILVAANLPEAKKFLEEGKADVIFAPRRSIPDLDVLQDSVQCAKSGSTIMTKKGSPLVSWWNDAFKSFVRKGLYLQLCRDSKHKYNFDIRCLPEQLSVPIVG